MSSDHPGDDALSALLDGEATPEEAAHVEACATCAARADELRRAANLIGSLVGPVDGERREAAIAAALGARVVSLEHRRRRQPPAWLLAAAVIVLALGLVPLLGRGDGGDDQDTAARLDQEAAQGSDDSAAEESSTMFRAADPVEAGDLGAVSGDELQDRVLAALSAPTADAPRETGTPSPDAAAGTGGASAAAPASCEHDIRSTDTEAGALRLTARATVDGRAAQILAFEVPGPEGVVLRVYVVADGDCGDILHTISFPLP